jgi:hypothetical protein
MAVLPVDFAALIYLIEANARFSFEANSFSKGFMLLATEGEQSRSIPWKQRGAEMREG